MKTKDMCIIAIMAAIMCLIAPLSLPIGVIPITLATAAVYLTGALLNGWQSLVVVAIYLLLGVVGVPVFSGYGSGIGKLIGPTGGYLVGYLPCAFIVGAAVNRFEKIKWVYPVSMVVGTFVLYALGTAWYMVQSGNPLALALEYCVIRFLPGDGIKIVAASILGYVVRMRLKNVR